MVFIVTETNRRNVLVAALSATMSSAATSNLSVLLFLVTLVLDLNPVISLVSGKRVEYNVSVSRTLGRPISIEISARGLELVVRSFFFLCRLILGWFFLSKILSLGGRFPPSRPWLPSRDDGWGRNSRSCSETV